MVNGVRGQGLVDDDLVEVPEIAGNRNIVRLLKFRADDAIVRDVSGDIEVPDFDDAAVTRLPHIVLVGVLDVAGHIQGFHHGVDEAVVGDRAIDGGMVAYDGDRAAVDDRGPLQRAARIEVDRAVLHVHDRAGGGQGPGFVQIERAGVGEGLKREGDRAVRRDRAGVVERVGCDGRVDNLSFVVVFFAADREIAGVFINDIGIALGSAIGIDELVRGGLVGRFDEFLERGFVPNVPFGDDGRIKIRAYDIIVRFHYHNLQNLFCLGEKKVV